MSAPSYYVWGADWMPLTARLNVQLIDEINLAMAGMRSADASRDPEIGGLLLGNVDNGGTRPVVRIERLDPVVSEHRRGSSYVLSDRDKKVLARKLEWWNSHGVKDGLRPVGFFRSHTRRGLYLDNDDFTLFQHYFPEPAALFLLVRPTPGADSVGGFFFWDEDDMHREASYQEFPFSSARLPLTAAEPVPAVAPPPVPPPAPVPAPIAFPPPAVRTPARRPATWLQVAIPLVIGVMLGAGIYKMTTHAIRPPATRSAASPTAAAATPAKPLVVEKPSPLASKSRPVVVGAPNPIVTASAAKPAAPRPLANADRAMAPSSTAAPTGSASRTPAAEASTPAVVAVVSPPPAEATPPPPAAPLAPITAPARVERPHRPAPVATVTVEPVSGSKIGRIVGHIPGFHRKRQGFVPARAIRQVAPSVPAGEHLARAVPVDLRITVDPAGNVADVEQASHGANRELVRLASDAARGWQFVPARKNDETVSSEVILHFMFPGSSAEP